MLWSVGHKLDFVPYEGGIVVEPHDQQLGTKWWQSSTALFHSLPAPARNARFLGMHRLQVMLMQHGDTATIFAKTTPQTEIRPGAHCFNALFQSEIRHGPHQAMSCTQDCFLGASMLCPACNRLA